MTGGSFTITNGGVFGSLASTPIINGTQAGILGMHSIVNRPVAVNGEVRNSSNDVCGTYHTITELLMVKIQLDS